MSIPFEGGVISTFTNRPKDKNDVKTNVHSVFDRSKEPISFENIVITTSPSRLWSPEYQGDVKQTHTHTRPPEGKLVSPYPFICIGLSLIDVGLGRHPSAPKKPPHRLASKIEAHSVSKQIGLKATVTSAPNSFISTIGIWGSGHMSGNSCTWLSFPYLRSEFTGTAAGTESVKRSTDWTKGAEITGWYEEASQMEEFVERQVVFNLPFQAIPTVIVWISGFQIDHQPDVDNDFGGSASNITKNGFTLRFHKGKETKVRQAQLTWIAFFTKANQVRGGVTRTEGKEKDVQSGLDLETIQPAQASKKRPEVLQAFSRFRLGSAEQGLRVKITDPVFKGEEWGGKTGAESWSEGEKIPTVIHRAEIAWIAF